MEPTVQLREPYSVEARVGRGSRKGGMYVYTRLIHPAAWQRPTQPCNATLLQWGKPHSFLTASAFITQNKVERI